MAKRTAKPADDPKPVEDEVRAEIEDESEDDDSLPADDDSAEGASGESEGDEPSYERDAESAPSWREALGGPYAELDDQAAVARLQQDLQQARQSQQAVQNYQYLLAQREAQLQQIAAAQQQQQVQAAQFAQQQQAVAWQPPPFDPSWLEMVKRDEEGNVIAKSGADPTLPAKIAAYAKWKGDQERAFYNDPYQFMWNGLYQPIQQTVAQQVQNAIVDYHNRTRIQDWEARHRELLYDQSGQPTSIFGKIVNLAKQLGGQSVEALDRALAQLRAEAVLAQAQTAAANGAAAQSTNGKVDFLKRNQRNPRRAGAVQKAGRKQPANRVGNFYDDAMKQFEALGIGPEDRIEA